MLQNFRLSPPLPHKIDTKTEQPFYLFHFKNFSFFIKVNFQEEQNNKVSFQIIFLIPKRYRKCENYWDEMLFFYSLLACWQFREKRLIQQINWMKLATKQHKRVEEEKKYKNKSELNISRWVRAEEKKKKFLHSHWLIGLNNKKK